MNFWLYKLNYRKEVLNESLPIAQKVPKTTWKQAVREIYQESLKEIFKGGEYF